MLGRAVTAMVLAIGMLSGIGQIGCGTVPAVVAQASATPATAPVANRLEGMFGRLPHLPLGNEGGMVIYTDLAAQSAAMGVDPPLDGDDEGQRQWFQAMQTLQLPQATGVHWSSPEWREAFGFDLFQVEQVAEYSAPPLGITVVRGSFDPDELRAAWERGGYQPIDLGAGEAYAVREDFAIDMADPGSRMALSYLNVVALADDGTLIFGSTRQGVAGALAAAAGQEPSFADRIDIAPLARAAPQDLVSALLLPGQALQFLPDPAAAVLGDESMEDFATRAAGEQTEARRLPPVAVALIGQTAGLFPANAGTGAPATPAATSDAIAARLVVALTTISPDAAAVAAAVIAERLETQRMSAVPAGDLADRPWVEIFPGRSVRAIPGEPVVLVELVPAPGVSPYILQSMIFQRMPGFLAWGL
jgi:hypothetical protein